MDVAALPEEHEQSLHAVLATYLEAVEAGQSEDRAALLEAHPELAGELTEFFQEQDEFGAWAAPIREVVQVVEGETATPEPAAITLAEGDPAQPVLAVGSFGDYELLRELGQGGMGIVYEARQRSLNRRVALKALRADVLASPAEKQRFRQEAETVALLDHPNIVPVYEVGEAAGRLFFSMKLVEGGSLTHEQERTPHPFGAADSRPRQRQLAERLATVARAVHHAHLRGILHRDLKPSNILLDREGQPHVTDFGLAKRVATDCSLTQSGALVGTPSYMAPEQAAGQKAALTIATDVYGLGAVLYALLTGRPPFRAETVLETLEQVKNAEPEPPRRLDTSIQRDLETICLKCLSKEPERRYDSAQRLAEDLERWLQGEPIQARRGNLWERLQKWVRRRPAVAALAAVVVLAITGLVAGLLWHTQQLKQAAERERRQQKLARQAVDRMYTQVATRWLEDEPQLTDLQRSFLGEALHFYQELAQSETAEPDIRKETARAHRYMGEILAKLERRGEAEHQYHQAIEGLTMLIAEDPADRDSALELATAYTGLGTLLRFAGRDREAEQAYRDGLAVAEKLVREHAGEAPYIDRVGILWMDLSYLIPGPAAEQGLRTAKQNYEQLLAVWPANPAYHKALGGILNNLAIQQLQRGQPAQAQPLLEQAIAHQQTALQLNTRSKTALAMLRNHYATLGGDVLPALGKHAEAMKMARAGLAIAKQLAREFPAFPAYRDAVADSQQDVGRACMDLGRWSESEAAFRQAKRLREQAVAQSPGVGALRTLLAETCTSLGLVLSASGQYGEATAAHRRALELEPNRASHKINLAWALVVPSSVTPREAAEALKLAREAVAQSPGTWNCWNALGAALYRTRQWSEAMRALQKAEQLAKPLPAPPHYFLAMAQWQLGERDAALASYRQVSRLMDAVPSPHPEWSRLQAEAAALMGLPTPALNEQNDPLQPPKKEKVERSVLPP